MAVVYICDADRVTQLTEDELRRVGWGHKRIYSPEAEVEVDAYYVALQDGAREARELFRARQDEARRVFHVIYPKGLLPDEDEDEIEIRLEIEPEIYLIDDEDFV